MFIEDKSNFVIELTSKVKRQNGWLIPLCSAAVLPQYRQEGYAKQSLQNFNCSASRKKHFAGYILKALTFIFSILGDSNINSKIIFVFLLKYIKAYNSKKYQ